MKILRAAPVTALPLLLLMACMGLEPLFSGRSTEAPTAPTNGTTESISLAEAPIPTLTPSPIPPTEPPHPLITRVVIISIDGLRPEAIDLAPMPILQGLEQTGAYTRTAQTTNPSTTLPSHASMLTGLCPAAHQVSWNEYIPENGYAAGMDIFDLAHAAGLRTVMVAGKEKLQQVTEPPSLDVFQWVNDPDTVVGERAAALILQGFSLLFVHFPDGDVEGHTYGWLSTQQLLAYRSTDSAIERVIKALELAAMLENTLIITTADHGGHYTTHGYDIPSDLTIPWIVNGPGVINSQLIDPVSTTDTAGTAAWALNLPIPTEWSGRPVWEAFGLQGPGPAAEPRCP